MIVFRVDSNSEVGLGHLMRCLSLADYAVASGKRVLFITADSDSSALIEKKGFKSVCLNSDFRKMEEEIDPLFRILEGNECEKIIIDSYYVTFEYLNSVNRRFPVIYVDDVANFAYPVNELLNYNIYAPEFDYRKLYDDSGVALPKLNLGTEYVPLRKEFRDCIKKNSEEIVKNVFVSTGGTDQYHILLNLARQIKKQNINEYVYYFVVGRYNNDKDELTDISRKYPNIRLFFDPPNMAELMKSCDLAVSSGGSTLYELCAVGLPIITFIVADNQVNLVNGFVKKGLAVYAGDARIERKIEKTIINEIKKLAKNKINRYKMIDSCKDNFDVIKTSDLFY